MEILIQIVKEDLRSIISNCGSIEVNKDFYLFRDAAKEMNLILLYTIDEGGLTIINQPQQIILKEQIQKMHIRSDINQSILDKLEKAVNEAGFYSCHYIKLIGG